MNCPRCKTPVGPLSNPDSIVTCPGCGSRLMTRSAALRSQGGPKAAAPAPTQAAPSLAEHPPSSTLPPTPAARTGLSALPGQKTAPAALANPPDGASRPDGRPKAEEDAREDARERVTEADPPALAVLLSEVRAVREMQHLILEALEELRRAAATPHRQPSAAAPGVADPEIAAAAVPGLSPIRARRRKTVVLVDDDKTTRDAAVAELQHAEVPVRAFDEGNAALSAIAEEKPDVIVLELGTGGDMGGKDLVNFVKATMEWVDIPIILWTREPVASQKEARQIHGADEVVPKSGGAAALVARVITVFRRA
jgi:CheY-like chemotaxis protein